MRVRVGDHDAYAYTGSRPRDAAAPNIVFVHGAANDHSVFALQSRYFAHHGFNIYAVDLPGHGKSQGDALSSVDALADWLLAFIEALDIGQTALVGHSLGSLIALETTSRLPRRVTALALLGTAVPMAVSDDLLAAAAANDHVAYELINGWSFSASKQLGGNRWPGVWMTGNSMRLMERSKSNGLFADLTACRDYGNGLHAAASVRCPTLLILGERDIMTPAKAARDVAAALSNKRIATLPDCGHAMMSEHPDQVLDALRAFLMERKPI